MSTPKPEFALDVEDIQIGLASQGATSGIALRFFLRDGQTVVFALPDHQATKLAMEIQVQLKKSAIVPPSHNKN